MGIQTTFGGNTPPIVGRVCSSWVNISCLVVWSLVGGSRIPQEPGVCEPQPSQTSKDDPFSFLLLQGARFEPHFKGKRHPKRTLPERRAPPNLGPQVSHRSALRIPSFQAMGLQLDPSDFFFFRWGEAQWTSFALPLWPTKRPVHQILPSLLLRDLSSHVRHRSFPGHWASLVPNRPGHPDKKWGNKHKTKQTTIPPSLMITLCNDSHDDNSHESKGRALRAFGQSNGRETGRTKESNSKAPSQQTKVPPSLPKKNGPKKRQPQKVPSQPPAARRRRGGTWSPTVWAPWAAPRGTCARCGPPPPAARSASRGGRWC